MKTDKNCVSTWSCNSCLTSYQFMELSPRFRAPRSMFINRNFCNLKIGIFQQTHCKTSSTWVKLHRLDSTWRSKWIMHNDLMSNSFWYQLVSSSSPAAAPPPPPPATTTTTTNNNGSGAPPNSLLPSTNEQSLEWTPKPVKVGTPNRGWLAMALPNMSPMVQRRVVKGEYPPKKTQDYLQISVGTIKKKRFSWFCSWQVA